MEGLEKFGVRAFDEVELESSVIKQHFQFAEEDKLIPLSQLVEQSGELESVLKPSLALSNKQVNLLLKLKSLTKRAVQLQSHRSSTLALSRSEELLIKDQILELVCSRAKAEQQRGIDLKKKKRHEEQRSVRRSHAAPVPTSAPNPSPLDADYLVRTGKLTPLDRLKGFQQSSISASASASTYDSASVSGASETNKKARTKQKASSTKETKKKSAWERAFGNKRVKEAKSGGSKRKLKRTAASSTSIRARSSKKKRKQEDNSQPCPICNRDFGPQYLEAHVEKCLSRPRGVGKTGSGEDLIESASTGSRYDEGGSGEVNCDGESSNEDVDGESEPEEKLRNNSVIEDDSSERRYLSRLSRFEKMEKLWTSLCSKYAQEGKNLEERFALALKDIEEGEEQHGFKENSTARVLEESPGEIVERIYKRVDSFNLEGGLRIPSRLYANLFEYQRTGLKWLTQLDAQGTGGILGDEQGLGKTCQICSFLAALKFSGRLKPSLIVCPATTLSIWIDELNRWHAPIRAYLLHSMGGARSLAQWSPSKIVLKAIREGDIIITTYQGLRLQRTLLLPQKWGYVILDEGHKLKNPDADITLVSKQLQTPHRIIISGTPIQNNLKELWSLFDFVYPGRLGTLPMFQNQFSIPINAGGYVNASNMQVQMAYRCAMVLKESIAPYLLRRLKKDVAKQLPSKTEQVLFCNLTPVQTEMYKSYLNQPEVMDIISRRSSRINGKDSASAKQTFGLIRMLQHICNHPLLFEKKVSSNEGYEVEIEGSANPTFRLSTVDTLVKASGKLQVLSAILRKWKEQGHRALVFSQSKQMLNILERVMEGEEHSYLRMDGDTSVKRRGPLVAQFNDKQSKVFVFLLTTKVGGVGINLTGANRVVLFDPDWNPSNDSQARERAWRIGQKKDVIVYRLITTGTIEEKIYHRQIFKQYLTNKVLLDPRQRKFFSMTSLRDLFTLGDCESSGPMGKGKNVASGHHGETETSTLFYGGKVQGEAYKESNGEESNLLKSLFDSRENSVKQIFSHDAVEDASRSDPDKRIVIAEATKVARQAAASLAKEQERCSRSASDIHVPTWTGQNGRFGKRFGGAGSAELLQAMRNGPVASSSGSGGHKSPSSLLASIVAHLKVQPRTSNNLLETYKSESDPHVFRELLREVATCRNGKWSLRSKYK